MYTGQPSIPGGLGDGRKAPWEPLVVSDGFVRSGQSQEVRKAYIPSFLHTVIRVYKVKGSFAKGVLLFLPTCTFMHASSHFGVHLHSCI